MSSKKKLEENFVITIEVNAIDSLVHGIDHFISNKKETDLKYAIIHIAHAVELFLKARLAKEHKLLIYEKPENITYDSKTVDFYTLIKRLIAVNVKLNHQVESDLKELQKFRNQIQHHYISANYGSVKDMIGRGLRFLESFLQNELNFRLVDEIDEEKYCILSEAIHSYEERLNKAVDKIENDLPLGKDRYEYTLCFCPTCYEETIVFPDPLNKLSNEAHCYFCNEIYKAEICSRCGTLIIGDDQTCEACWNYFKEKNE